MSHPIIVKVGMFLAISTIIAVPVVAHNVEISNEIAATFHITPNHNPKAENTSQAWFALTLRGGKSVALSECNCQLNVYVVPRAENAKPVLMPELMAIDVEKYQEVPGTNLIFPQAGAYELELSGKAKNNASFSPFKLTYTVNVRP